MNIEIDSYALSPMQQGMLFHQLAAREPGVDVEQIFCRSPETIEASAFENAWQAVVDRHPIFRTTFHWNGRGAPCQKVWKSAKLDFRCERQEETSLPKQDQAFNEFLGEDRHRGFELSEHPPMRVALFHYPDGSSRFLWTMHHILLDGRGVTAVLNEVFSFYEAELEKKECRLPPPQEYRQYIDWLQAQDWSSTAIFWRKSLAGFSVATPISSRVATPRATRCCSEQEIRLNEAETAALKSLASQNDLTPNTILQAGWALLLSRYSREEDVVFGAIRACRRANVPNGGSIIGLLINTVPVRVRVAPEMPVLAWLKTVRENWIALRNHEHASLADVQGWSGVPRGEPLFETIFNYQDPSWDAALRAQGGKWTEREFGISSQPNYPLAVDAYGGSCIVIKLLYHRARFDDAAITRMLGNFATLLKGLVTSPDALVGSLSILTETEHRQVMMEWNGPAMQFPAEQCIHHLFEEQVRRTPDALAVADGEKSWSYAELNRCASSLAGQLRKLGIKPGTCVGVCLERSAGMVAGKLGIWKAGGAYLPLNPSHPADRLNFMIEDAGVQVMLIEKSQQPRFLAETPRCRLICVDEPPRKTPEESPVLFTVDAPAQPSRSLAYIIYTSGSTGRPKGVEIEHRSLANLVTWHQHTYKVIPSDRASQTATPAFDACVWELWPYLTAGASVHLPNEATRLSSKKLVNWLADQAITLAFVSTPLAEMMFNETWPEHCQLRALLTGGDKLRHPPGENLPCALVNHYGPTENTVVTTWTAVPPTAKNAPPAIGRPIPNTQVYILDANLQPVPVGVAGELHVGGAGLARGYRNRPELTSEKFITSPFHCGSGDRLYKTGDLACWQADGQIEFLGRLDQQVKIRGQRIEPGEIESVLTARPGVREAIVTVHQNERGENWLAAHVIASTGENLAVEQLRAFLKQKLPDAMVPSAFVQLENFSLTPNGKIDRRALPKPSAVNVHGRQFALPRTSTEEKIAAAWAEVIGVERVGVNDNFFELGGHSLTATQVASRLLETFKIEIPLHHLFDAPTVRELGEQIDKMLAARDAGRNIASEPAALASVA